MFGLAVFSVLIGCIVIPIIYITTKCLYFFVGYGRSFGSWDDESESDLDQDELLRRHGYEIAGKIGQGTYADVKKAYSINLQKDVAVKIVSKTEVKNNYKIVVSVVSSQYMPNLFLGNMRNWYQPSLMYSDKNTLCQHYINCVLFVFYKSRKTLAAKARA